MSGTVADVLRVAESQLGCTDGAKYFSYFGYPDLGPWCVAGARWTYAQAGVDCHWSTFYAFDWSDAPSQYAVAPRNLMAGDFVSFDWDGDGGGDHVGIVTGVYDWGISTIEFNTGGGVVARKQRVWDVVICGIRPTYRAQDQWIQAADGRWWYRHADGSYTRDGWERIGGEWYYFDAEGWMVTGWVQWSGDWYYLSEWTEGRCAPQGHMVHGGVYPDFQGRCFRFYDDGRMQANGTCEGVEPWPLHDGDFGMLVTA